MSPLRLLCTGWLLTAGATLVAAPADLVRLNLNENPFGPSPHVIAAIAANLTDLARYTDAEAGAFAQAVAKQEGIGIEQVVLGDILEALGQQLALQGGAGGEFIYSAPGYTALVDAAKPFGGTGVAVPLDDHLANDLPALRAAVNPRTRAVFLVNPHNPSGVVSDGAVLHAFVREVSKRALVIVDEAYLEFTDDFAGRSVVDLVRAGENVIVFRTFSKAYGLAALPIGYAIAPAPLAARLREAGVGHPRSLNRLALVAAIVALGDQEFITGVCQRVTAERAAWLALFDELKLRHTESAGNFVFFQTGRPHAEFGAALRVRGIEIGRSFPPLDDWARISIGLPEDNARARAAVRAILVP